MVCKKRIEFILKFPDYMNPMLKEALKDPSFLKKYNPFIERVHNVSCAEAVVTLKEDSPEIDLKQGQIVDTDDFRRKVYRYIRILLKETGHFTKPKDRKRKSKKFEQYYDD